ncbi:hypothetical protein Tco_1072355 [Tanacetum coccineum]
MAPPCKRLSTARGSPTPSTHSPSPLKFVWPFRLRDDDPPRFRCGCMHVIGSESYARRDLGVNTWWCRSSGRDSVPSTLPSIIPASNSFRPGIFQDCVRILRLNNQFQEGSQGTAMGSKVYRGTVRPYRVFARWLALVAQPRTSSSCGRYGVTFRVTVRRISVLRVSRVRAANVNRRFSAYGRRWVFTSRYLHGYGVCRQKGYAVLGIGQTCFLVKSWRGYAVSLLLDMAYWYEHVGLKVTRSQEGKRLQDDEKRRCMVDDLKKLKITGKSN